MAIGVAQEFQWVFTGYKRATDTPGAVNYGFDKAERRVTCFYFYVLDEEFGLGFVKIASYFPYPAKVWVNGHEWAKRQAAKAGLGFTELANGFASCEDPAALQKALRELRRTPVLAAFTNVWSAMGVHREAEFNKRHVPGYLRGEHPRGWLCLYPFVRSYEWYLLPEDERSRMLAEHGRKGAAFRDVVANTVSTFGLSDYEWLLPLESDDPISLVDMMRELRATDARRHVREEVPFYTGRRVEIDELAEVLS